MALPKWLVAISVCMLVGRHTTRELGASLIGRQQSRLHQSLDLRWGNLVQLPQQCNQRCTDFIKVLCRIACKPCEFLVEGVIQNLE